MKTTVREMSKDESQKWGNIARIRRIDGEFDQKVEAREKEAFEKVERLKKYADRFMAEVNEEYIMATENPFVKLFAIDFKDHLEVKKSGNTELKYVSWAYAWAEVKKLYPAASYEVKKFNGLPYVYDPITGFMV